MENNFAVCISHRDGELATENTTLYRHLEKEIDPRKRLMTEIKFVKAIIDACFRSRGKLMAISDKDLAFAFFRKISTSAKRKDDFDITIQDNTFKSHMGPSLVEKASRSYLIRIYANEVVFMLNNCRDEEKTILESAFGKQAVSGGLVIPFISLDDLVICVCMNAVLKETGE